MTGNGECYVYKIEARRVVGVAIDIEGVMVDGTWREVPICPTPDGYGVTSGRYLNAQARECGYLSKESATALAWWFIAECEQVCVGIEARLVEFKFKYSYSAEQVAEGEPFRHSYTPLSTVKKEE